MLGLNTRPIERLQAFTTDADCRQLEAVRVVAQEHAYDSDRPREVRRQWAKPSLLANRRMHGDGPGDRARAVQQDFVLRMWVIDHLGSDDKDPDWSPEKLASDTLDALALTPPHARALTSSRRELPIEQIRELRRHKNLTAHLERLINHLHPGSTRNQFPSGPRPAGSCPDLPLADQTVHCGPSSKFGEHVNALLLQDILSEEKWQERLTDADRRALSRLFSGCCLTGGPGAWGTGRSAESVAGLCRLGAGRRQAGEGLEVVFGGAARFGGVEAQVVHSSLRTGRSRDW
ncbi:hypothetical protein GCM10009647_068780 [Streptomyces sanglieri]|uniref:Uncharacterized protein n=1 Tax=Streptomyces sanglieri TaxID=193460 RepID=A0ABW2WPG5_9ACTN